MIKFKRSQIIDAKPEDVWKVIGNYMEIDEFAPQIVSTEAMTDGENGVGSVRKNVFANGGYMVEEVTDWKPGTGYTIKATEMPGMPLKAATSDLFITPVAGKSKVTWTFNFRVKFGPLGWLMGQTMMKMMMGKVIDGNLKGLEERVLSGQTA